MVVGRLVVVGYAAHGVVSFAVAFAFHAMRGMYLHAERLLAKAGGSKCKERGITHPCSAMQWSGKGRSAAEGCTSRRRGSLGRLLARARGQSHECTGDMLYKTDRRHGLHHGGEQLAFPGFGLTHEDAFMPWKETRTVDQRLQFLSSYQKEEMSVTDLCHEYGISRPTAYKWIKRYDEVGPEGLLDLTRTPHTSPNATSGEIENEILALRKRFPSWGARKLKARLERMNPNVSWPAASTVGQILSRAGLTNPKRKKRRATPSSQPFSMVTAPNQLWCMDFKGYFLTGDGYRCDPFTITDAHSRFLIRCQAVARMDLAQV